MRRVIWGSVAAAVIAVAGVWYVGLGQRQILAALEAQPRQAATLGIDYTDRDGAAHHISVQSERGESPEYLVQRLKAALAASEKEFPRR